MLLPDLSRLAARTGTGPGDDPMGADANAPAFPDESEPRWFAVDEDNQKRSCFRLKGALARTWKSFDADPMAHRAWTRGKGGDATAMESALDYKADHSKMLWTDAKPVYTFNVPGPNQVRVVRCYTAEPNVQPLSGVFERANATGIWDDYTLARDRLEAGNTVEALEAALASLNVEEPGTAAEREQRLWDATSASFQRIAGLDGVMSVRENTDPHPKDLSAERGKELYEAGKVSSIGRARRHLFLPEDKAVLEREGVLALTGTQARYDAYQTRAANWAADGDGEVYPYGMTPAWQRRIEDADVNGKPFMTAGQMTHLERNRRAQMKADVDYIVANFYGPDGQAGSSMQLPRADRRPAPLLLIGVLQTQQGGDGCGMCTRALGVTTLSRDAQMRDEDELHARVGALVNACQWL
jgi:hypothetical protein